MSQVTRRLDAQELLDLRELCAPHVRLGFADTERQELAPRLPPPPERLPEPNRQRTRCDFCGRKTFCRRQRDSPTWACLSPACPRRRGEVQARPEAIAAEVTARRSHRALGLAQVLAGALVLLGASRAHAVDGFSSPHIDNQLRQAKPAPAAPLEEVPPPGVSRAVPGVGVGRTGAPGPGWPPPPPRLLPGESWEQLFVDTQDLLGDCRREAAHKAEALRDCRLAMADLPPPWLWALGGLAAGVLAGLRLGRRRGPVAALVLLLAAPAWAQPDVGTTPPPLDAEELARTLQLIFGGALLGLAAIVAVAGWALWGDDLAAWMRRCSLNRKEAP